MLIIMQSKDYIKGDYEKYIQPLTKENMQQLFIDNFGGWSDEVSKNKFFKILEEGHVQLFFLDKTFIGYVSFNLEKNNNSSCLINDIHIVKEYQKQGQGTKILNLVINKAKKLNCNQLKVFVFKENPSINFYKKHNFKEIEFLEKSNTSVMTRDI